MYVVRHLGHGSGCFKETAHCESFLVVNHIAVVQKNLTKEALVFRGDWEYLGQIADEAELQRLLT